MDDVSPSIGSPGGWRHVVGGLVAGLVLSTVVVVVLLGAYDLDDASDLPLWTLVPIQAGLWTGLVGAVVVADQAAGRVPLRGHGLSPTGTDLRVGLAVGVACQFVLVPLIYVPIQQLVDDLDVSGSAEELTDRADALPEQLLLGVMVVLGAPLVEELFYRGLVQGILHRHLPVGAAVVASAAIFAVTHFQVVTLPALFAFGLVLGVLRYRTGRLGRCVAAHMGFNLVTVVVLLS